MTSAPEDQGPAWPSPCPRPDPGGGRTLPGGAICRPAVGVVLRQDRTHDRRRAFLLLVPAPLGTALRRAHDRGLSPGAPRGAAAPRGRREVTAGEARRQHHRTDRLPLLLRCRHRPRLRGRPLAPGRRRLTPRRVGPGRPQLRHLHHLVPARRRPLHGLHLHRGARARCTPAARSASSPCRTRSWSTRWSSCSCRGCGRSRTGTATSPRPTSSGAGTTPGRWRSRSRSPASSPRCRTSPCSWSASRRCST